MPKLPSSPVSMSDIAIEAGVSESTVSRALNDNKLISVKTRKKIQAIAREMNYKFNESARSLRLQRSHTVSVVINSEQGAGQSFSDPFMMDLIGSIADELSRHRYDLLFSSSIVARQDWHAYLLGSRRADGVIVIGQGKSDLPLRELHKLGDPIVVWGGTLEEDTPYCIVGSDNILGGRQATDHLIGLGRRRILFLGDIQHAEINARYQGYLNALRSAGLETHQRHIDTTFSIDGSYQCVLNMLNREGLTFDAVFTASDNIAMGTIKALQQKNYTVPGDVSVVGFDDIPIAPFFTPPLTTVRQNVHLGGEILVRKILTLIDTDEFTTSEMLPTELVVRGSCGANPSYNPADDLRHSKVYEARNHRSG